MVVKPSITSIFSNNELGNRGMNETDFDPFKMQNDSTTAADTLVSQSSTTYSAESSSTASEQKKKKKKEKKSSKKSKSSSVKSGAVSSSYSEELFGKMLADQDGFSNNFGDFTDIQQGPRDESIDESGSRRSMSTSRASSHRTPATSATCSRSSGVFTDGVPSEPILLDDVSFSFPVDEDLFSPKRIDEDDDDDDDSDLSEITGLTGAFLGTNVYGDFDDEEDEEDDNENIIANESRVSIDSPRIYSTTSARRVVKNEYMEKLISAKATEKRGPTKKVSFSNISVRHYERVIEENPSTIKGPSIGIGWKFEVKGTTTIDHYEVIRGPPRPSPQLVLTVEQREKILSDLGYTQRDIANAVRNNLKARNQRRQTVQNLKAEKIEEALEGAGKRVKRILNPFSKQK